MRLLWVSWFSLACACAGGSGNGAESPEGGEPATEEEEAAASEGEPESEYDRKLRTAKERLDQCTKLVDTVQKAERPSQNILNINDATAMNFLAKGIERSVEPVEKLSLSLEEIDGLRKRYVDTVKQQAAALRATAAAGDKEAKKAELARFRKLDEEVTAAIEHINTTCASTPEESAE